MSAIYVHIPFCARKCHYCGFYSVQNPTEIIVENYIQSLLKEISATKSDDLVQTIFFGGGTPTLLATANIERIMNCITHNFNLADNCEITIEANPVSNIDFQALHSIGFNRISIGVQSFNDTELQWLGRLHNSKLAHSTILNAKKHFNNVSIDLMYAIPVQTLQSLKSTINTALQLDIQHISAYSLSYDSGTNLTKGLADGEIIPISADADVEMYYTICEHLAAAGYKHYEVSNYAKKNYECLHNLTYWQRGNYYGFGAAAHSCIDNVRYENMHNVGEYRMCNREVLDNNMIYEEAVFLALRSIGASLSLFNPRQMEFIETCIRSGYGFIFDNLFALNDNGKIITDEIVLKLLAI